MKMLRYWLALGMSVWLIPLPAENARDLLQTFLSDSRTIQADFSQTMLDTGQQRSQQFTGRLYVQRPGRFRWQYDGADGQSIIADGKRVWLVEPDLQQVSHRSQQAALRGTPAVLLTGEGDLEATFQIRKMEAMQGLAWLELLPIDPESQFQRILLGLQGGEIRALKMADKFGQLSEYRFSNVRTNIPLDPSLFDYRPPDGFDLIEN